MEPQVHFEVVGDFTYKALEGKLPQKQSGALLVLLDFPKCDCSGSEPMLLVLDTSTGWGGFSGCFLGQSLLGGFATGGFSGGLFGTGHFLKSFGVYRMYVLSYQSSEISRLLK